MVHSLEISCLSYSFSKTIVENPRSILRNWRRFLFLTDKYTKTYLTFQTCITKREISSCLHGLLFNLCKVLFLTSFSREYSEHMEMNFGKLREAYLKNILIYNKIFHYLHIYNGLRYTKVSMDPNLQNFCSRMHKERMQLVTRMPHHQLRVVIKFDFLFFVTINP